MHTIKSHLAAFGWQYLAFALLVAFTIGSRTAEAQYFGQNKPRYETFDWKAYQTPNFEIYNYLEQPADGGVNPRLNWIGRLSEDWYANHSAVLRDSFTERNLMLLYNDHADFQQTNAISGGISTGTGGVTEAFKNRVIYPFAMSNHQTDHVLGHELVHAFQYHMILGGDSTNIKNLGNLPLWMVEGLAEYMSIGRVDAHTSMWMRDAVLSDDVPTMKQMNNPKYFPYRWGQAWWAFVTGMRGDDAIRPIFEKTAQYGLEHAIKNELGMRIGQLDTLWIQGLKKTYGEWNDTRPDNKPAGKLLVGEKQGGGRMNIAPQVSPDGKYVIFLSEKNLFSIDLFLADARSGEIIRQVSKKTRAGHIDDFAFVESAGAWAPKSDRFAYVGVAKGRNVLIVSDVASRKTLAEYELPGLQAFDNPTWSPDGKTVVVSGLKEGQVDLYEFTLASNSLRQLTNSFESELLPSFNADGTEIVFSQDATAFAKTRLGASAGFDIAILDVASGVVRVVPTFAGADNLNPGFDDQGDIVFLSNYDGFRDVYRVNVDSNVIYRMTALKTGVSGITAYAPAISLSPRRDRIAYTFLEDGKYSIYSAKRADFLQTPVEDRTVTLAAAVLPTLNKMAPRAVDAFLQIRSDSIVEGLAVGQYAPVRNPFKVDFIGGGAGVGTSVGNPGLGTQFGAAGGVNALFSDVLGGRQIFTGVSLNGQLTDATAQFAYVNRERPFGYGLSLSHVPYRAGFFSPQGTIDTVPGTNFEATRYDLVQRRIFEDRLGVFVDRPFSRTLRVEGGASFAFYNSRQDISQQYYDRFGRLLYQERERDREADLPKFNLGSVSAALVGDNSVMGLASPLQGYRFRVGVEQMFGDFNYTQTTLDGRLYQRFKPVTLAARFVHYGRHGLGEGGTGVSYPFYVGNQFFVRGLSNQGDVAQLGAANDFNFNALVGNNIGIVNAEVRLPFTGPKQLSLIPFKAVYSELTAFVDGGLAYNSLADVRRYYAERGASGDENGAPSADFASLSRPIITAGVSLRANVLGAIIVEPYYARVINQAGGSWKFGVNLVPGW